MIKIESLTIQKFRGIKELTVPFQGKSWVICGRNGSGKSGVVDAIEFGLSGTISRLSGEGRGDVTIKEHGPHVDFKNNPKDAVVNIAVKNIGDTISSSISRNCFNPSKYIVTPKDKEKEFSQMGKEIVLSRREILKFILTEPGKRSKEVQALLKIDKLDEIRLALQTSKNKVVKNLEAEKQEFERTKSKLIEWIEVEELSKESLLKSVNKHRKILSLIELTEINDDISLSEGIKTEEKTIQYRNKQELLNLLLRLKAKLLDSEGAFSSMAKKYLNLLESFSGKENELKNLNRIGFYEAGMKFIDSDACPFCEIAWKEDDLKKVIQEKVKEISGIKSIKADIDTQIQGMKIYLRALDVEFKSFAEKVEGEPNLKSDELLKIRDATIEMAGKQETNLDYLKSTLTEMNVCGLKFDQQSIENNFKTLASEIAGLPEKSNEEKSKEFLIICQERIDGYRASKKKYEYQKLKANLSEILLSKYNEVSERYLNNLYTEIEKDFSRYYGIINHDDEAQFAGSLIVQKGALNFEVDFYNRGKFPPAAYHSEGHQDGMGLCLYLALMKKILGRQFTLAILDDVLMSIDADHKKSICRLLKQEFPDTQFIITTHDKYWQKQMITEGLVSHSTTLHFKNWSVDTGPSVWNDQDSWSEIEELIAKENISGAASTLRRFLEFFMDEMSVRLAASIPRSASGDHDLGELLTGSTSRYGELLKKAKKAARSWENKDLEIKLESEKTMFDESLKKARNELWGMNATVHFNSWADMGKKDFVEIKNAYFELVNKFKCGSCSTLVHVIPIKGSSETLKCDCAAKSYNLKEKEA